MKGRNEAGQSLSKTAKGFIAAAITTVILGILIVVTVIFILPTVTAKNTETTEAEGSSGSSRALEVGENKVRYRENKPFYFTPDKDGVYIFETTIEDESVSNTYVSVLGKYDNEYSSAASNSYDFDNRSIASLTKGKKYDVEIFPYDDYDEPVEDFSGSVKINVIEAPEISSDPETIDSNDSDIYYYTVPEDGYYSFESSICNLKLNDEDMESIYSTYSDISYITVGEYSEGDTIVIQTEPESTPTDLKVTEVSYSYFNAFDKYTYLRANGIFITSSAKLYYTHSESGTSESYSTSGTRFAYSFYYNEANDEIWIAFPANTQSKGNILMWYKYS